MSVAYRSSIVFWITFLLATNTHAQKVQVYVTSDGRQYSQEQRDSIENLGNFVGLKDTRASGDTLYTGIFYYDKSILLSKFQKKYVDQALPRINLSSITGDNIDTDKLIGKIIVINFWSTHCGPCIGEFPDLNRLKQDYMKDVYFIGIAKEGKGEVLASLQKYPFDFTIISDAETLLKELGIEGFPKTFFVDRKGIIRILEEGAPVKTNADGTLFKVNGEWVFLTYENYSKMLNDLMKRGE